MINGKTLTQMSKVATVPGGPARVIIEVVHEDVKFKQYLREESEGMISSARALALGAKGALREQDIIQFYANGLRTVAAEDIVDIS